MEKIENGILDSDTEFFENAKPIRDGRAAGR